MCQKTDILYKSATKKLYNKETEEENPLKCPYAKNSNPKCERMIEQGLDGKVSDFDIEHYCNGNPINCYYYRLPRSKKDERNLEQKISAILRY
jgi:hypothetical protein